MKRFFSLLMALVLVCGVCVCISSCGEAGDTSSADETSEAARNTVFTDEYFEGAVHICMSLYAGDYGGEEMEAVIEALKQSPLEPTDRSIYPWKNESKDSSDDISDNKVYYWMPFICCVYYADGSEKSFKFTNGHVAFSDDENYDVPTNDFCKSIMDAVGIKEGEYSCTEPFSEYFQDYFCPGVYVYR